MASAWLALELGLLLGASLRLGRLCRLVPRRRPRRVSRPGAALARDLATLVHRVGDHAAHQLRGPDGVVVAGDHVVDDVGVAVRVDDRDDRDVQPVRLGDRDVLLLGVDHEHRARHLLEVLDAAEVALELGEVAADLQPFLLGHLIDVAGVDRPLQLAQLGDA